MSGTGVTRWIGLAGAFLAGFISVPAFAQMHALDLRDVNTDMFAAEKWDVEKQPQRLVISCADCDEFTAIDVQVTRADNTEAGIRDGSITAQTMLDSCRSNAHDTEAECYNLKVADLKNAVGFVSDVRVFENVYSNTYTLYQDGWVLVMRGVSDNRDEARRVGDLAYNHIAPQIVR